MSENFCCCVVIVGLYFEDFKTTYRIWFYTHTHTYVLAKQVLHHASSMNTLMSHAPAPFCCFSYFWSRVLHCCASQPGLRSSYVASHLIGMMVCAKTPAIGWDDRVLLIFSLGWSWTLIFPLICTSWVAQMTGESHCPWPIYGILVWQFFSFSTLKISFPCFLASIILFFSLTHCHTTDWSKRTQHAVTQKWCFYFAPSWWLNESLAKGSLNAFKGWRPLLVLMRKLVLSLLIVPSYMSPLQHLRLFSYLRFSSFLSTICLCMVLFILFLLGIHCACWV